MIDVHEDGDQENETNQNIKERTRSILEEVVKVVSKRTLTNDYVSLPNYVDVHEDEGKEAN